MSRLRMFVRRFHRRLPGRIELVAPALLAVGGLGGIATSDAISQAVIADLRIGKRASRRRTRADRRPTVVQEVHFSLQLLSKARLLRFLDGEGWQITDDGKRLLAENVAALEVIEIVRAAQRKKMVEIEEPIVGLRELPIPPRGSRSADQTPCTYALQSTGGADTDIKLGRSTLGRLWERTDENDSRGEPLRITRLFAGGRPTEQALHQHFAPLRRRANREWFRASPELARLVYAIPETPGKSRAA